ncbi:Cuticle protein 2 [Gryllus bimaculatus]|nr:Cuticle protein 2 [Gryllus bimaculatus]
MSHGIKRSGRRLMAPQSASASSQCTLAPHTPRRNHEHIVQGGGVLQVVLSALLAVALAKPQFGGRPGVRPVTGGNLNDVPIVRQASDVRPDGYSYSYETGNGIQANEEGVLENAGNPELEAINARGGFSYVGDDGVTYTITYVADAAGGFQPQGAHLPTPPPVP